MDHAAEARRHWLLILAILIATLALLYAHADGQPVPVDPARGPYDDRVPLPALEWSVASGEQTAALAPALAGGLSSAATLGGGVTLAFALVQEQQRLAALGATAFALGPSLGHWFGGTDAWNDGLKARLGGAVTSAAGLALILGCEVGASSDTCDVGSDAALLGAAAYLAGMAYEIATAPGAARASRVHRARISVVPVRGHEQIVPGLALSRRF